MKKKMNDAHLFKVAREWSMKASYTGGGKPRLGCIVVYKNAILAGGYNSDKTHPAQEQFNRYRFKDIGNNYLPSKLHAELNALNKIKFLDIDFSRVHIYIYRETRDGHVANARPCKACMAALRAKGIVNIHYTTDAGYAAERLLGGF